MLWVILLITVAVFIGAYVMTAPKRAYAAHQKAQLYMAGQTAIEVGQIVAKEKSEAWRVRFEEATILYASADADWWKAYRRAGGDDKATMVERRLRRQRALDGYIDPLECVLKIAEICRETASAGKERP